MGLQPIPMAVKPTNVELLGNAVAAYLSEADHDLAELVAYEWERGIGVARLTYGLGARRVTLPAWVARGLRRLGEALRWIWEALPRRRGGALPARIEGRALRNLPAGGYYFAKDGAAFPYKHPDALAEFLAYWLREAYADDEITMAELEERLGPALAGDWKGAGHTFPPMASEIIWR